MAGRFRVALRPAADKVSPTLSDPQPNFAIRIILGGLRFSLGVIRHTAIFVVGHRRRRAWKNPQGSVGPTGREEKAQASQPGIGVTQVPIAIKIRTFRFWQVRFLSGLHPNTQTRRKTRRKLLKKVLLCLGSGLTRRFPEVRHHLEVIRFGHSLGIRPLCSQAIRPAFAATIRSPAGTD